MQISIVLGEATRIAKEHSINKISVVMIVGRLKITRSGPKNVTAARDNHIATVFSP